MNKLISCVLFSLFVITLGQAQPKLNSPFSRIGFGDLISSDFSSSYSMGGLSAVYHDFFESNIANPASHGFLQYTSFQVGMHARRGVLQKDNLKSSVWSGNLEHLSLGIPIINPINELLERRETVFSWGTNISISPYSRVGYSIESTETIDSLGQIVRSFTGEGGTYKVLWGNGWKYKNLSLGLNLGYLFGKETFVSGTDFLDLVNDYNNVSFNESSYRGFLWNVGVIYEHPMDLEKARAKEENPSKLLSIGAYLSSDKSFDTESEFYDIALNQQFLIADTARYGTGVQGSGKLPSEFSIGIMYREASKMKIGINFTAEAWSKYSNEARPEVLRNSWKLGIGYAYIPDANSITSYFKRVEYRFGINYMKDPRVFANEQMTQFGLHVGMGLPFIFQRQVSWINLGLEYGNRGTSEGLKENYFQAKVGFTLNDNQWFIKSKYI